MPKTKRNRAWRIAQAKAHRENMKPAGVRKPRQEEYDRNKRNALKAQLRDDTNWTF